MVNVNWTWWEIGAPLCIPEAVTVTVLIVGLGTAPLPPLLPDEPPPPHPANRLTRQKSASCLLIRFLFALSGSKTIATAENDTAVKRLGRLVCLSGVPKIAELSGLVATVTVTLVAAVPLKLTVEGLKLQLDPFGRPVHENETGPA